jgi:hypothetical protein
MKKNKKKIEVSIYPLIFAPIDWAKIRKFIPEKYEQKNKEENKG